jgi:hypothetical protein
MRHKFRSQSDKNYEDIYIKFYKTFLMTYQLHHWYTLSSYYKNDVFKYCKHWKNIVKTTRMISMHQIGPNNIYGVMLSKSFTKINLEVKG